MLFLAAIILFGESSCFVSVRAKRPRARAKVRVRVDAQPVNQQGKNKTITSADIETAKKNSIQP